MTQQQQRIRENQTQLRFPPNGRVTRRPASQPVRRTYTVRESGSDSWRRSQRDL
jgi:hypothetical protein